MSDIVETLRKHGRSDCNPVSALAGHILAREAADEIDALRARIAELEARAVPICEWCGEREADNHFCVSCAPAVHRWTMKKAAAEAAGPPEVRDA